MSINGLWFSTCVGGTHNNDWNPLRMFHATWIEYRLQMGWWENCLELGCQSYLGILCGQWGQLLMCVWHLIVKRNNLYQYIGDCLPLPFYLLIYVWCLTICIYCTNVHLLCRTMACFHVISISLISGRDHHCAHYLHYFYVPWLIMASQWVMMLLGMPHCGIQWVMTLLGTSIVTSQWIMTLHCVYNMVSQWIMTLLGTSFPMYYYVKLGYCCFTSKLFNSVHINHENQYPITSSTA